MDASKVNPAELEVWRKAQQVLSPASVSIPYAGWLASHTPDSPIRMRRDFGRLLALIEVVAVLHQLQRPYREEDGTATITATLADYYIARALVGEDFGASSHGVNQKVAGLVEAVRKIYSDKVAAGDTEPRVSVADLASRLGKVQSTVRTWLKPAIDAGWVEEVEPAKGRRGASYAPGRAMPNPSPLPPVEEMAAAFPDLTEGFSVIDPITGEQLELEPEPEEASVRV